MRGLVVAIACTSKKKCSCCCCWLCFCWKLSTDYREVELWKKKESAHNVYVSTTNTSAWSMRPPTEEPAKQRRPPGLLDTKWTSWTPSKIKARRHWPRFALGANQAGLDRFYAQSPEWASSCSLKYGQQTNEWTARGMKKLDWILCKNRWRLYGVILVTPKQRAVASLAPALRKRRLSNISSYVQRSAVSGQRSVVSGQWSVCICVLVFQTEAIFCCYLFIYIVRGWAKIGSI